MHPSWRYCEHLHTIKYRAIECTICSINTQQYWQDNCPSHWSLSSKMCWFCSGLYYNTLLSSAHSTSQVAFPHDNTHSLRTAIRFFSMCLHGIESVILMLNQSSNCCQETNYFGIYIKICVWVVRHLRQSHLQSWLSGQPYIFSV